MEKRELDQGVPKFSIIVTVYNEEENVNILFERLVKVMERLANSYEIIFVDDGSIDGTFGLLEKLHQKNNSVKIIRFSRNFGHHIAITAGLDYAQADTIILMDGDLQDQPEEIPRLYEKYKEGYDNVYAIRRTRKDPVLKKIASKLFYKFFKIICNFDIPQNTGVFRIISRRTVNAVKSCRERSRFVLALISWVGLPSAGVIIERSERHAGKAKYNFLKSTKLAIDAVISFSQIPLQITVYFGFFIAMTSFSIGLYMLLKKIIFGMPTSGYASIIVSIFFLGGIQIAVIGIVGGYIGRVYSEVQNRPMYIIKEFIK
jgi:glycosyltransferase involved in cell wall biosynthesis